MITGLIEQGKKVGKVNLANIIKNWPYSCQVEIFMKYVGDKT